MRLRRRPAVPGGALAVAAIIALLGFLGLSGVSVSVGAGGVLAGDATVEPVVDTDSSGLAEAFKTTAATGGSVEELNVYLDVKSTATKVVIGLYSDNAGHPGTLLAQGSTTNLHNGAWNTVTVPATQVSVGTPYWLAVLGTGGTLAFRDRCCGSGTRAENALQTALTALPSTWSSGKAWSDGPASVYASSA